MIDAKLKFLFFKSMISGKVLHQPVKPSLRFALSLLVLHMLAATVVFMTAMPLLVKLVILLLIALSLIYYLAVRTFVLLLLPSSWREISLSPDGLSVIARDGSDFLGKVTSNTVVSPYFVVLCVRLEGHRLLTSRVIFPDALSADAFRELCVRLKFI